MNKAASTNASTSVTPHQALNRRAARPVRAQRYTRTAAVLHWLMAVLLCGMVILGFYMQGLSLSPDKLRLYSWHKWAGISIFLLALLRMGWRLTHRPPALADHLPAAVRLAAAAGHASLYVLMLAIPVSGWLMSSAKGVQTVWFGVVPLPDLIARNKVLGDALQTTHYYLNLILIAMVAGHVLMALKHHFIDRDGSLKRMLPFRNTEY